MPTPYTVVLGVTTSPNNEVLIAKVRPNRIGDFHGLQYVTPGGVVEAGETFESALARELLKETGGKYVIMVGPQLHARVDPTTDEPVVYYWFSFGNYDHTVKPPFDTSASKTTEELLWVPIIDLPKYDTHSDPVVRSVLTQTLSTSTNP